MSLFDRFVRKEKFNRNTGKFEVTQVGLNLGFSPGEEVDPLNEAVKDFYADKKKKKREKRKATGVKIFNSYMDLSERFVKSQSDPKNPMNQMFGNQQMGFPNPMMQNTSKKKSKHGGRRKKSWKDYEMELEQLPSYKLREIARGGGMRADVASQILKWEETGKRIANQKQNVGYIPWWER